MARVDPIYQNLAPYYDKLAKNFDFAKQHLEKIDKILDQYKFSGEVMIDIACGTGTIAIHLAKRFSKVIGTDISPAMLSIAKSKVGNYRRKINFVRQDMRNLSLPIKADLITCNFDSINYLLKNSEIKRVFRNVCKHMNKGGLFIFDACTPCKYKNLRGISFRKFNKNYSIWTISNNINKSLIGNKMLYFSHIRDNLFKLHEEIHMQRAYERQKIINWLGESGFYLLKAMHIEGKGTQRIKKSPLRILYVAKK